MLALESENIFSAIPSKSSDKNFNFIHCLLSSVPMPDPIVERTRRHIDYDPSVLDQSGEKRELREIRPGHFILATSREYADYEYKLQSM